MNIWRSLSQATGSRLVGSVMFLPSPMTNLMGIETTSHDVSGLAELCPRWLTDASSSRIPIIPIIPTSSSLFTAHAMPCTTTRQPRFWWGIVWNFYDGRWKGYQEEPWKQGSQPSSHEQPSSEDWSISWFDQTSWELLMKNHMIHNAQMLWSNMSSIKKYPELWRSLTAVGQTPHA